MRINFFNELLIEICKTKESLKVHCSNCYGLFSDRTHHVSSCLYETPQSAENNPGLKIFVWWKSVFFDVQLVL